MDNDPSTADINKFCALNEVTIYNKLEVNDENSFRKVFSGRANNFVAIMENEKVDSIYDLHIDRRSNFCVSKCQRASYLYGFRGNRGGVVYFDKFPISTWYVTIRGHGYFVVGLQTVENTREHSLLIERLLEKQISSDPSTQRIIQKPRHGNVLIHEVPEHEVPEKSAEEIRRDFQLGMQRLTIPLEHDPDPVDWGEYIIIAD
jgi:hypothetical protein